MSDNMNDNNNNNNNLEKRTSEWISESTLIKVQAGSGLVLSVFVLAHLANHVSALWGQETFDRVLGQLRSVYQAHPVSEIALVVVAPMMHVGSSILRVVRRNRRAAAAAAAAALKNNSEVDATDDNDNNNSKTKTKPAPFHIQLARFSGFVVSAFMGIHVVGSRLMPILMDTPKPDAKHLATEITGTGFGAVLMLFSCLTVYHMSVFMIQALSVFQKQLFGETRLRQWIVNAQARHRKSIHPVSLAAASVGCGLMVASVLAMSGRFFPVETEHAIH